MNTLRFAKRDHGIVDVKDSLGRWGQKVSVKWRVFQLVTPRQERRDEVWVRRSEIGNISIRLGGPTGFTLSIPDLKRLLD